MSRSLSTGFINSLEAQECDDLPLIFLTLTHDSLVEDIRFVNDVVDYLYQDNRFYGFPFAVELLSDDDTPPKGQVTIPNLDVRIGLWLRQLSAPPRVKIEVLTLSSFGDVTLVDDRKTRPEAGSPAIVAEYTANHLTMRGIQVNNVTINGTLDVYDPSTESYPSMRATRDRVPGLFR